MIYELVIDNEEDEVFAISLVEDPAIEMDFVYFNKDAVHFAAVDTEKRLVMGPILIPDKQIVRMDGEGKPYWVFFKSTTIEKLAQNYLQKKYNSETTLEHNGKIEGVSLVESWIVESRTKDKSALYNLSIPAGTWMGTFKITNDKVWDDYVKTGKVKGFSIEGIFEHKLVKASTADYLSKDINDLTEEEAKELLNTIHSLLMPDMQLEEGVPHYTADGELYTGPTHKDADGRLMTGEVHTEDSEYLYHKEELEAQPAIISSYPGEPASGSISEETL